MAMGSYLSIITLNVNGLNGPIKRQKLAEWVQKKTPIYTVYRRNPPQNKGHIQTEGEGLEKVHTNEDQKKAGVVILISDKIDFEIKAVKRDKKDTI